MPEEEAVTPELTELTELNGEGRTARVVFLIAALASPVNVTRKRTLWRESSRSPNSSSQTNRWRRYALV